MDSPSFLHRLPCLALVSSMLFASTAASSFAGESPLTAEQVAAAVGVHGGLCVQIGGDGASWAAPLAGTGRFLVHVLCPDGIVLAASGLFSEDQLKAAGLTEVTTIQAGSAWTAARKPRPAELDGWTHARHSASGNDALAQPSTGRKSTLDS